jgi:predicted SnoaL-like aldol condensation-catalyzing enzyme
VSTEENKAIVRRLIEELWNAGNPELADLIYAADYVRHGARDAPRGDDGHRPDRQADHVQHVQPAPDRRREDRGGMDHL